MYVHWKSLILLGLLFFIMLCYTDGMTNKSIMSHTVFNYQDYFHDHKLEQIIDPGYVNRFTHLTTFIVWNFLTFGCSFCVCACLKKITKNFCTIYYCFKCDVTNSNKDLELKERQYSSKIPILTSKSSIRLLKVEEDDIIRLKPTESSCPNLLTEKKTEIIQRPFCHTIFKNNTMYSSRWKGRNEYSLESKCSKLREEILQLQSNSMKDHGILTRQIDTLIKEKTELTKQLTTTQKENRAAKQQIDELIQEKILLHQRLESATQEFRSNTRSKKMALAKLEEVTSNVDNLKMKLEQVTRDKEILENKLSILQEEYEKLQERVNNQHTSASRIALEEPERDESNQLIDRPSVFMEPNLNISISRTELDVQKVQNKIDRLEEDLRNFHPPSSMPKENFDGQETMGWATDRSSYKEYEDEEDISVKNFEDPLEENIETPTESARESPRWSQNSLKDSSVIGDNVCPSEMADEDFHGYTTSYTNGETTDTIHDEDEDDDSLDGSQTHHIVSSSEAFQNFLKNLSTRDSRRGFFSLSAVNFNEKFVLH